MSTYMGATNFKKQSGFWAHPVLNINCYLSVVSFTICKKAETDELNILDLKYQGTYSSSQRCTG